MSAVTFEPSSCEHVWQLARSQQKKAWRYEYGPGRILGNWGQRVVQSFQQYERVDEFYCTRCLKEHVIRRRAEHERDAPDWWSDVIETSRPPYQLWYPRFDGSIP